MSGSGACLLRRHSSLPLVSMSLRQTAGHLKSLTCRCVERESSASGSPVSNEESARLVVVKKRSPPCAGVGGACFVDKGSFVGLSLCFLLFLGRWGGGGWRG